MVHGSQGRAEPPPKPSWLTTLGKVADLESPCGTTGLEEEVETGPFCNADVWGLEVALIGVGGKTGGWRSRGSGGQSRYYGVSRDDSH